MHAVREQMLSGRSADPRRSTTSSPRGSTRSPTRPRAKKWRSSRSAAMAAASWRRSPISICCFCCPTSRRRIPSRSSNILLYLLWDLGLKVGQATRSVAECLRYAKADLTIRTALLEARYVWGEQALFTELKARFEAEIVRGTAAQFVEAKLAERDARHQRVGDSRYQLEPNVKEGKGGLRDLHTLFWIAKYIYRIDDVAKLVELGVLSAEESARFERAQSFLWTVRCHLHYLAGRAEERLTFPMQTEIGARMGYTDHAGSARRRALHEALFPGRQGCRRPDPHLLRDPRDRPEGQAPPVVAALGAVAAPARRLRGRRRAADDPVRRFLQEGPGRAAAAVSRRAGARPRHPPARAARGDPIAASDRCAAARGSRGQPPVPRNPDLEEEPGNRAAADERGRRVRPLHSRFRPRRRADAVRHVPSLHGRRAHAVRDRHPAPDRDRPAEGRAAGRQRHHADDRLAPRALSRDPAARHRQGPRRRPFRARREDRAETGAAPRAFRRGDRDRRLAGALASADEQHRLQARHRRPADDPELCRAGAIARAAEAAAGADRRRYPRGRAQGVERLEGGACCASCTTARST